ncbi:dTMP kinase [Candidatus Latescibacterota bacterium]
MQNKGYLITLEGIDGCGKTTQAERLFAVLADRGLSSHLFREPGGTVIGEKIRSILLDPSLTEMHPLAELFLYLAARVQITDELIRPSLEHGDIVVMDRYSDSTVAYQGYARGIGSDTVSNVNAIATMGLRPDVTFIIDCDPVLAMSRVSSEPDRLESEGLVFMERVREGFLELAKQDPKRYVIIDGSKSIELVGADIDREIARWFDFS